MIKIKRKRVIVFMDKIWFYHYDENGEMLEILQFDGRLTKKNFDLILFMVKYAESNGHTGICKYDNGNLLFELFVIDNIIKIRRFTELDFFTVGRLEK